MNNMCTSPRRFIYVYIYTLYLAILLVMVKWPFQRLSDLQLGDQKVTLNCLVCDFKKRKTVSFKYVITYKSQSIFSKNLRNPPNQKLAILVPIRHPSAWGCIGMFQDLWRLWAGTQSTGQKHHLSSAQKPPMTTMKSWLVNRDPYNGLS